MTQRFDFFELQDEERGIDSGLIYEKSPHVTLGSIARNERLDAIEARKKDEIEQAIVEAADFDILHDTPIVDSSRIRVSGPFTIEALSRYSVNPAQDGALIEHEGFESTQAQDHVDTLLDALKKQGIPGKPGEKTKIESLQRIANAGFVQAEGTYEDSEGKEKSFAVSLGPRFGPITVAQVDDALHDAYGYDLVVFAGFAADPEAQKYVAKGRLGKFNVALLWANPDLLVGDLLKSTASSQTFRLFASPDVKVKPASDGEVAVEVIGIDSFDASTGEIVSRSQTEVAAWFLDQDYDGVVFHVTQAFFPKTNAWEQLQRALKETVDPELLEQLETFESLPFKPGEHNKVAVRVIDDFGTASEVVLDLTDASVR